MTWFEITKAAQPTLDELTDQPIGIQDLLDKELPEYLAQRNVWEDQVRVFTSPSPSIQGQLFRPAHAWHHKNTGRGCATIVNLNTNIAEEWTPLLPNNDVPESIANIQNMRTFQLTKHQVGVVVINLSKEYGARSNRQIIDIMVPEDSIYTTVQTPSLLTNGEAAILFIHKPPRDGGVPTAFRRQVHQRLGLGTIDNNNEFILSLAEKGMMKITPHHAWQSKRNYPSITAKGKKFAPQISKQDFESKFRQAVVDTPNEPFTWNPED